MSLTKSTLIDDASRDLSPVAPEYGEDLYDDGPWPTQEELENDADNEQ